jgi:hypothetical protein
MRFKYESLERNKSDTKILEINFELYATLYLITSGTRRL